MVATARDDAERAAVYVVSHVAARAGSRLRQGPRKVSLASQALGPALDLVATTRLLGVSQPVSEALVAWGEGRRRVHLLVRVPTALELLAWQAAGERCVSLLPPEAKTAPHADGLAFALHDLCHLEKFVDPSHFVAQVGFFAAVHDAMRDAAWGGFVARFDAEFQRELEHVVADMNGSAVFLFAALKMKLKMAVRRRVLREQKTAPEARITAGPLTPHEESAFRTELLTLLALLRLTGEVEAAALGVSTRRHNQDAALVVLRHLEAVGSARLPVL